MRFLIAIVTFTYFAAIEAKHKSESCSDVSSEDSNQDLTAVVESSDNNDSEYPDDIEMTKTKGHHHKHNMEKVARAHIESRRWNKSCFRKASKLCTKACQTAYKTVCKKRKCSKRSKKTLKKECKKSCTKNFEFDKERAAYEE